MTPTTTTEKEAALSLMESVLRDGRAMAAEYPLVFEDDAPGRIEAVEANGSIASACAWLTRTLLTPSAEVPVAIVGSLAGARHGLDSIPENLVNCVQDSNDIKVLAARYHAAIDSQAARSGG